jgi:hypothetical protein
MTWAEAQGRLASRPAKTMSFRTAMWVILALLVVPMAGVMFTIFASDKAQEKPPASRATKQTNRRHPEKPEKPTKRPAEQQETEPLPAVSAAASSVIISGDSAKSASGLAGGLSWLDDAEGSRITNPCPASGCMDESGVKLCAKGKLARTGRKSTTKRWGAELAWNVHEDADGVHPLGKSRVKGLSFKLDLPSSSQTTPRDDKARGETTRASREGKAAQDVAAKSEPATDSPVQYLFALRVGDTDYCTPLRAGKNRVLFTDLRKDCTARRSRQKQIPAGIIAEGKTVKWQVPSLADTNERFDFCLSDLRTIDR